MKKTLTTLGAILLFSGILTIVIISCKKENKSSSSTSPTSTGCPSTSACGCSAKNKADCDASTQCCKWTTGQGCGCK